MDAGKILVPSLKDYHFSDQFGFLLEDPLESLPEYFSPWKDIASRVSQLLESKNIRDEVLKMPKLDESRLEGYRQWRLANTQLTCIGSAYIWQGGTTDTVKSLPPQLAVPWYNTAKHLGIPPGITYGNLFLQNYRLIDKSRPLTLENMEIMYCPARDKEASHLFYKLCLLVDAAGTPGIKAICSCMEAVLKEDEQEVMKQLEAMNSSLTDMSNEFKKVDELMDPDKFFNEVSPFITGWGAEGSPITGGLIYEGVSSEPITIHSTRQAQNPAIHCFDAALKIHHEPDKVAYLKKICVYMAPAHAELIEAIRRGPNIRKFVEERGSLRPDILKAFNRCVDGVTSFRAQHIQIVTTYVLLPARRANRGPGQVDAAGGQPIMPFLKAFRDTTQDGRLE